jgi:N-acetylglucosamine-6-phosphate deacetylase
VIQKKAICADKIYTPFELWDKSCVLVSEGKIVGIKEQKEVDPSEYDIVNFKKSIIVPGFIDIHTHGVVGHDSMETDIKIFNAESKFYAKHGVTSFVPTTMAQSKKDTILAIKTIREASYLKMAGAKIIGIHLEGPYFNLEKKGAQPGKYIRDADLDELQDFMKASNNFVVIVSLAPEIEKALEAIRFLSGRGITISLGHTNATFEEANRGIDAGATHATHIFNGMRPYHHREPGVIGAVLLDNRVTCEVIADLIHLHPRTIELTYKLKGPDRMILVSDSMGATGLNDGNYQLGGEKVIVKDSVARLENGSLAGSTLTLDKALRNIVNVVGIPFKDALRMITYNPTREISLERNIGSISIGKMADLVVLDESLKVKATFIEGKMVFGD